MRSHFRCAPVQQQLGKWLVARRVVVQYAMQITQCAMQVHKVCHGVLYHGVQCAIPPYAMLCIPGCLEWFTTVMLAAAVAGVRQPHAAQRSRVSARSTLSGAWAYVCRACMYAYVLHRLIASTRPCSAPMPPASSRRCSRPRCSAAAAQPQAWGPAAQPSHAVPAREALQASSSTMGRYRRTTCCSGQT